MLIATTAMLSFTMLSSTDTIVKEETNTVLAQKTDYTRGPKIGISAKPYRAIKVRPRDGKTCDCKQCFGICDVKVTVSYEFRTQNPPNFIIDVPSKQASKARLYVLRKYEHAESEFGIDEDLVVSGAAIEGFEVESITIPKGVYRYVAKETAIGEQVAYGYVDVKLDIQ